MRAQQWFFNHEIVLFSERGERREFFSLPILHTAFWDKIDGGTSE
jgi:hypothetical protein